jgi:hypothetical protein
MQLKEWADIATVITAIATIATVIIGFFAVVAAFNGIKSAIEQTRLQLNAMHLESRKWNTLNICAQYELNDVISNAARNIFSLSKIQTEIRTNIVSIVEMK